MSIKKEPRLHQKEAIKATSKNDKGIIHLPTGTGKTYIQALSIIDSLEKRKVYVVLAPRILLGNQLYSDIKETHEENEKDVQFLVVHSGNLRDENILDDDYFNEQEELDDFATLPFRELTNTTSSIVIKEVYEKSQRENVPLVVISTYHSAERIMQAEIPVEVLFCDEAHYLLQDDFRWITNDEPTENESMYFNSNRKYFFTATLKHTDSPDGIGMQNTDKFGEVIYTKTPVEMIDAGEILRPRMHLVNVDKNSGNERVDAEMILDAYKEHRSQVKKTGAKMLVTCKDTESLNNIVESEVIKREMKKDASLTIFDITAKHEARINGKRVDRKVFLEKIKNLKDEDNALIFHVRILTEGIDVPGITGVFLMNNMKLSNFMQTLGRATRLHLIDRKKLYSGNLTSNDLDNFIKPYAWVIIPVYKDIGEELKERLGGYIRNLRNYNFIVKEGVVIKQKNKGIIPTPLDEVDLLDEYTGKLADALFEIEHSIESEEDTNNFYNSIKTIEINEGNITQLFGL